MKVEVEQVKQDDNDMKEEKKEKEIQKRKRSKCYQKYYYSVRVYYS